MRSSALKNSPPRRQTLAELRELQRLAGSLIFRPLDGDFQTQKTWTDGEPTESIAATFIKPNERLTSFERIEIYNRQYWYRLIDIIYEDYPGLLAVLGNENFSLMTRAYLAKYPSRSFSLRNLGSKLAQFLAEEPNWSAPHQHMALDMARFEWAQIVAFDGPGKTALSAEDLAGRDPATLRLGLQPYLTIVDMAYPLDKLSLATKKQAMRTEASNAMEEDQHAGKSRQFPRPRRKRTIVAVYRLNNDIYFKRLEPAAFHLLRALQSRRTLPEACEEIAGQVTPKKLNDWFAVWTTLGWFCKPN